MLRTWLHGSSVAMDLGTAWSRVQARGDSAIRIRRSTVDAGGGRVSALRDGVVCAPPAASVLARALLDGVPRRGWRGPRVLACVPSDACAPERQALVTAIRAAGATDVALVPEPLAAAVGADTDLGAGWAHMVVDVGEGVTDATVVGGRGAVASAAVRLGCAALRAAAQRALGGRAPVDGARAEAALRVAGVAAAPPNGVDGEAWRAEIEPVIGAIVRAAVRLLRRLDDRTVCQVIESGIALTGGGALLPGMRSRVEDATQVETRVARDPLHAVIRGAAAMLHDADATGLWTRPRGTPPRE